MPEHLFCYGTLTQASIMRAVCGSVPVSRPAVLHDYACFGLTGRPYPAIVHRPGSRVNGLVYLNLQPAQLARLDQYEGTLYTRARVSLGLDGDECLEAWTYVLRMRYYHLRSRRPWSLQEFLHKDYKPYRHRL